MPDVESIDLIEQSSQKSIDLRSTTDYDIENGAFSVRISILAANVAQSAGKLKFVAYSLNESPDYDDPSQVNRKIGDYLYNEDISAEKLLQLYIEGSSVLSFSSEQLSQGAYLKVMIGAYAKEEDEEPAVWTGFGLRIQEQKEPDPDAYGVSVACSAESAVLEESVTWTAEGRNGVEPYKYRFELFCDGVKVATRAYSTTNTYTFKFTKAGTYYVLVQLKDDDGEIIEAQSANVIVSLESLQVTEVTCDKETLQTTETAIWNAAATGGEQPYQYSFTLKCGTTVVDTQDYSTVDIYSHTFEHEGSYSLEVAAKDNLGTVSAAYTVPFNVALRPVEITQITANANSTVTESSITWTVEVIAGKAPYTYDYEVKLDGVSKLTETGSSENTFAYNTETAGSCVLSVTVTDAAGNVAKQDSAAMTITTKALTIDAITAASEWVKVGDEIRWTVDATGGVAPLKYAFDVYINGEEQDGRSFKTDNTYSYAPEDTGDYYVKARVRDAADTTIEQESTIVHVYDPISVTSITADQTSVLTGEPVVWTATVNGGKGTINYNWFIYCGDELEYTGRSTENSIKWAPMRAGTYKVTVKVTDEDADENELSGGSVSAGLHASTPVSDFTFNTLNGTYCEITGYTGNDIAIVLPSEDADGHIVQKIANKAFQNNKTLASIVLSNSIETIGSSALSGCTGLITINCGDNLTTISSYAFSGCTGLVSVSLPDGLETIYSNAFANCTSLESIHLPDSITTLYDSVFSGCSKLTRVNYPLNWATKAHYNNNSYYSESPFYNCAKLTGIVVPEGVTSIPANAFRKMTSLKSISLPSTLTTIGNYAFYVCTGLNEIDLSTVTSIGESAFYGCTGLRSITVPSGCSLGSSAFSGCSGVTSVVLGSRTGIPYSAFSGCTGLVSVSLPDGLETIYSNAFANCTSLESIHLPDSITTLYDSVFSGCSKLTRVNYPLNWATKAHYNNNSYYSESPFYNCAKLTGIVVPEGVTSIPANAFRKMTSLKSISLPSTLTAIGNYAFYGCTGLTAINIESNVGSIGSDAFYNHNSSLIIYGEAGSYAETYASNNSITFSTDSISETTVRLSGRVLTNQGDAINDATVKLYLDQYTGNAGITVSTDSEGYWTYADAKTNRSYLITVAKETYVFSLPSQVCTIGNDDVLARTVYGSVSAVPSSSISGTIMDDADQPIQEIRVYITNLDDDSGTAFTDLSDENGQWKVTGLITGQQYRITYATADYKITPSSQDIVVVYNMEALSATASLEQSESTSATISFTMTDGSNTITQTPTGQNVVFNVQATDATKARLIVDGNAYESFSIVNGTAVFERAFAQAGIRSVAFQAGDESGWNKVSASQTLQVTATGGQLANPTFVTAKGQQFYYGNDITITWNSVPNASAYALYLYCNGVCIWHPEALTNELSHTFTADDIPAAGDYPHGFHMLLQRISLVGLIFRTNLLI